MNDVLVAPRYRANRVGSFLKHVLWRAASHVALYGLCGWDLETRWLTLERREAFLPGLGGELDGLRVAHLSDLHLSPIMRQRHLAKYIELTNELQPDFAVITGDFVWASARCYARQVAEIVGELSPKIGTIAVLGNHDYGVWMPGGHNGLSGLAEYLIDRLRDHGATVLHNDSLVYRRGSAAVAFAGVGDLWTRHYDPAAAMDAVPTETPIIALTHNPDASGDLARLGADYVLAGHTHGKAVPDTPLNNLLFPVVYRDFAAGEYTLGSHRRLYVNRGLGPSRRVQDDHRPEISLLTFRSGSNCRTGDFCTLPRYLTTRALE
ncbi:MAG: metallophosphoesterase [Phycisphaerae bacterium]